MGSRYPDRTTAARVTVWDLPTRLFHWSIVILLGLAWWTAEQNLLEWHRRAGYTIFCLLIFRLMWGFFGSRTARFSSFFRTPAQVFMYIRKDMFTRDAPHAVGHNPLGGWAVVTMLAAMMLQTLLGLVAVDVDGLESGPLSYLVSFEVGRIAANTHHYMFNILLALITLHLSAIAFHYFYKKQNLTKAMIIGNSIAERDLPRASPLLAAILLSSSALLVFLLTNILGR